MQSTLYRVTVTDSSRMPTERVVSVGQVSETLIELLKGKINPEIKVEPITRQVLDLDEIDQNPTRPAVLMLKPWGSDAAQVHKLDAIKALRGLSPGNLGLKEAKDAVEQGLEIFSPWDLTAQVAEILADGLARFQLYAEVCAREDEANQARSYSPCCHCDSTGRDRTGDICSNCNGTCCSYHYQSVDPSCKSCRIA